MNSHLVFLLIQLIAHGTVIEYVSPSLRNVGLNTVLGLFYSLGLISASWLAVLVGHWKTFLACSSLPLLLVTLFYFLVQESAQWLVTRNDIDGAIQRLQRVAKINGRVVHDDDFKEFSSYCRRQYSKTTTEGADSQARLTDMLRTPRLRSAAFKMLIIL